ncbi:MAG: sigma-70 family RNA polymerase sigma factor [Acidobacteriaceae bacterium]|nr:sigma-70 family RNA polymerase sigma factor [Acidobacteriaceae bacterium]MBV9781029.1 sigma-70 family RNA polymerase sigma factor [Acidobacteriaceae bacterium]
MRAFSEQIAREGPDRVAHQEAADSDARFCALVERQARFVFRVAHALLRKVHDAEDVVQETFVKVYRGGKWESVENERAFLATVAWRIAVERLAKRRREKPSEMPVWEMQSRDADPEQNAIRASWNRVVHGVMDGLPEELRQPLALSTVEDLNSREIARVMRIPEGTVRTRLMRARQLLRAKLSALMEGRYEGR